MGRSATPAFHLAATLLLPSFLLLLQPVPVCPQQLVSRCGGAGYDLSSLASWDLRWAAGAWEGTTASTLNVCGVVTSGACAGSGAWWCTDAEGAAAAWQPDVQPIFWSATAGGVVATQQWGGLLCLQQLTLLCDWSADEPYIGVLDAYGCRTSATVFTSLTCLPPLPAAAIPLGLPLSSLGWADCGAPLFDLSSLDSSDLRFSSDGVEYWWRPCSSTSSSSCRGGASFCGGGLSLAYASNTSVPWSSGVQLTSLVAVDSGLLMQTANGQDCVSTIAELLQPQTVNTLLVCDPRACSPIFLNLTVHGLDCRYTLYISTDAVCPDKRLPSPAQPWEQPAPVSPAAHTCGGAGYDVSQSGVDMTALASDGTVIQLHPCGNVTGSPYMMYAAQPQLVVMGWYAKLPSVSALLWGGIKGGVQLTLDFDVPESEQQTQAETAVQFLCLPTAVRPYFAFAVLDYASYYYVAVIWTAQACSCNSSAIAAATTETENASWQTAVCGGGAFNLTAIAAQDWVVQNLDSLPSIVFNVCGAVRLPGFDCPANSSVCIVPSPLVNSSALQLVGVPSSYQYSISQSLSPGLGGAELPSLLIAYQSLSGPSANDLQPWLLALGTNRPRVLISIVCSPLGYNGSYSNDGFNGLWQLSIYTPSFCNQTVRPIPRQCNAPSAPPAVASAPPALNSSANSTAAPSCYPSSSSSLSSGAIAGIVVGSVVGAALLNALCVTACCFQARRRRKAEGQQQPDATRAATPPTVAVVQEPATQMAERRP